MLAEPLHGRGIDEFPCAFKLSAVEFVQIANLTGKRK